MTHAAASKAGVAFEKCTAKVGATTICFAANVQIVCIVSMSQAVCLLLVAITVACGVNNSIIFRAEIAIAIAATIFAVAGVTIIAST